MESTTASGLTVVYERAAPEIMETWTALEPPPVQPWAGWPTDQGWSPPTWNGVGLDVRVGTAMTCADLNSRQLGSFPVYAMRGRDVLPSLSWMDCPEPALYADWTEAAKQVFNSLQLRGEAILWATGRYAFNGPTMGKVARFVILNPDRVGVEAADGEIHYSLGGDPLERRDVLHVKHQSWPGHLRGIGPIEWTAANVIGAAALQSYLANLATRGGVPWAVIKNKRAMQGNQAKDLQDAWVAAAATRNGAPAVLSGDLELDVLTISPKDMALLDLRIFDEQRIAAAFGVPPFLVGLPDGSSMTYSNVSQVFDFHWRATLRTMGGSFFSALSRWALPAGQRVECNPDRYVEPDFAARAAGYATMAGIVDPVTGEQAMTVAEIRARERFSPASDPDAALELTTVGAP